MNTPHVLQFPAPVLPDPLAERIRLLREEAARIRAECKRVVELLRATIDRIRLGRMEYSPDPH